MTITDGIQGWDRSSIGAFLLRRLREAGVTQVFGVPGDFNLNVMQQIEDDPHIEWVGTCNELNGAYAADGYGRIRGLSALFVTYGVGALSAMNGIAGAYSERVPVVCVCGAPPAAAREREQRLHHSLGDGGRDEFRRAFSEVTAAQSVLTPQNAVTEIDRALCTARLDSRPVYVEIPSDITHLVIRVPTRPLDLRAAASDSERVETAGRLITARLDRACAPALLVDIDVDRCGVSAEVGRLAERAGAPIAVMNTAKGVIDETHRCYLGAYHGAGSDPSVRRAVEDSDCLLAIGYRRIDSTTGFFSDRLPDSTIHLRGQSADVDGQNFQAITLTDLLDRVLTDLDGASRHPLPVKPIQPPVPATQMSGGPLTQAAYWRVIQSFVRAGDVLVADAGTSAIGAGSLTLPAGCTFVTQAVWGSIGYGVGSLLGTLIAAPQRRHLLFVGDGSFQQTAQELSTILRHDLKPIIFLVNNGGYTIERAILGKQARYNDIADWAYTELPRVFRPDTTALCRRVGTVEELVAVVDEAARHDGLVLIEAVMDRLDAPPPLTAGGHRSAELDYGPRGPQRRPDIAM